MANSKERKQETIHPTQGGPQKAGDHAVRTPPAGPRNAAPQEVPSLKEAFRHFLRLVRLIRPYWAPLFKGMVLALILGLFGMVTPYKTKLLIDEVYPTENISLMHVIVAGILALALASTFLGGLRGFHVLFVDTRLSNATRLMFFNRLQHLKARFFSTHRVGEVNSRFQDVGLALQSISHVLQTVFVQGVYLLLVPPVLFLLEWRLALVALISVPLTVVLTALSGRILRRYWKRSSEAFADINAFQIETLSHIETFKSMGLEYQVYRKARGLIDDAMQHQITAGGLSQVFGSANGLLRAFNTALFTWFGWTLILGNSMTLGELPPQDLLRFRRGMLAESQVITRSGRGIDLLMGYLKEALSGT